jgi:hypothetical protein
VPVAGGQVIEPGNDAAENAPLPSMVEPVYAYIR